MSAGAAPYYYGRARGMKVENLPPLLNGEPVNLAPKDGDMSAVARRLAAWSFIEEVSPLEPVVLHGVRNVPMSNGKAIEEQQWVRIAQLPRQPRFITVGTYAARHIVSFVEGAVTEGASCVMLEAVPREQVPMPALRRLMGKRSYFTDKAFEPSQMYLVTSAALQEDRTVAQLTVLQGVYDEVTYPGRREYLTPRISGVMLKPEEVAAARPAAGMAQG